jgi:hypothetical protein
MATIRKLIDGIAIENDAIRVTFPLEDGRITRYSVYGRRDESYQLGGTISPISQVTYLASDGSACTEKVVAAGYEMDRRGADCILRLESEFHDVDGVRWSTSLEFYVPDHGPRVTVTSRLATSRPRQLLGFRGPFVRVPNEEQSGVKRTGLFPGLDWVVGDEPSSSEVTAPSPFSDRYVPHPYKVTVPVMTIAQEGLVVGITWDPLQVWDGEHVESAAHRYPSAVFSSPDTVGGSHAHLMGLFVPSVPKFVDENTLTASRPYEMTPGREIKLECNVFVRQSEHATDGIQEYVRLCGLIPPPPKVRDYKESLELDIETYLDRAWSPKHAGWAHSSGTDEKWTFYSELVALALWRASLFAKDKDLKRRIRDSVEEGVSAHADTSGLSMAYFRGGFNEELSLAKGQLDKLMKTQQADGGWAPDDDVSGRRRGRSLVGVSAENASKLLRSGLLTGDRDHLNAGTRAVRFLDQFDRPDGLRIWDVHESAPDLLAATHLLAANLDLYLISGTPGRLERAVYWAWAALPFVYLWHAHDRDVMRYATVPYFAVTQMDKKPWFGVAAQWNGLIYAHELFRLSRYDRRMRWHRLGRAITMCGVQMQKTGKAGTTGLVGFYPDAYNVVDGRDYYPLCLNPQLITRNVLNLLGEPVEPTCEVVPWREHRCRVATVAHILAIRSSPRQLMVRLGYHKGETCYVTLADSEEPSEVRLGDQRIERVEQLAHASRAWTRDVDNGLTIVRIAFSNPEEMLEFRF